MRSRGRLGTSPLVVTLLAAAVAAGVLTGFLIGRQGFAERSPALSAPADLPTPPPSPSSVRAAPAAGGLTDTPLPQAADCLVLGSVALDRIDAVAGVLGAGTKELALAARAPATTVTFEELNDEGSADAFRRKVDALEGDVVLVIQEGPTQKGLTALASVAATVLVQPTGSAIELDDYGLPTVAFTTASRRVADARLSERNIYDAIDVLIGRAPCARTNQGRVG